MSRNCHPLLFIVVLFTTLFPTAWCSEEAEQQTKRMLREVLANWKTMDLDVLRKPENANVVTELKKLSLTDRSVAADTIMLNLGDPDVTKLWVDRLCHSSPRHRNLAIRRLAGATNPELMFMVEKSLFVEENPDDVLYEEDTLVPPVSMAAAGIIRVQIGKSAKFSPEVKNWAASVPDAGSGLRDNMRTWWRANKQALERRDFPTVVPLGPKKENTSSPKFQDIVPEEKSTAPDLSPDQPPPLPTTAPPDREELKPSTPWVIVTVVIVLTVGLVWLATKKRK